MDVRWEQQFATFQTKGGMEQGWMETVNQLRFEQYCDGGDEERKEKREGDGRHALQK